MTALLPVRGFFQESLCFLNLKNLIREFPSYFLLLKRERVKFFLFLPDRKELALSFLGIVRGILLFVRLLILVRLCLRIFLRGIFLRAALLNSELGVNKDYWDFELISFISCGRLLR